MCFLTWLPQLNEIKKNMSSGKIWEIGCQICEHQSRKDNNNGNRKFRNFFGTSSTVCAILWEELQTQFSGGTEPKHLLWSLLFLRQYHTENQNAALVGVLLFSKRRVFHAGGEYSEASN